MLEGEDALNTEPRTSAEENKSGRGENQTKPKAQLRKKKEARR